MDRETLTIVLAATAVLLALWLSLGQLLVVLGQNRLVHGFQGGPEEASQYHAHDVSEELYRQVAALGFVPFSVYWEQLIGSRTFTEFVFVKPRCPAVALLYPNDQIMPQRGSFLTVFESGAAVHTKNYAGADIHGADFQSSYARSAGAAPPSVSQVGFWLRILAACAIYMVASRYWSEWALLLSLAVFLVPGQRQQPPAAADDDGDLGVRVPLAEVLAVHEQRIQPYLDAGDAPMPVNCEEDFLSLQQRYYGHPVVQSQTRTAEANLFLLRMVLLVLPFTIVSSIYGFDDPRPWGIVVGVCLLMAYFRYGLSSAQVVGMFGKTDKDQTLS